MSHPWVRNSCHTPACTHCAPQSHFFVTQQDSVCCVCRPTSPPMPWSQPPFLALNHAPTEGLVAQGLHPSCAGDHCLGYRVHSRPMRAAKEENPHVKQCIKVGWKNGSVALVENWGFVPKTHVRQLTATAFNSSSRGSNALSGLVWPLNSYGQISTQTRNQNKTKTAVVCLPSMHEALGNPHPHKPPCSSHCCPSSVLSSPALLPDRILLLTWTQVLVTAWCPDRTQGWPQGRLSPPSLLHSPPNSGFQTPLYSRHGV